MRLFPVQDGKQSRLSQANNPPIDTGARCSTAGPREGSSVGGNLDKCGGTLYPKQRLGGLARQPRPGLPSSPDSGTASHSVNATQMPGAGSKLLRTTVGTVQITLLVIVYRSYKYVQ